MKLNSFELKDLKDNIKYDLPAGMVVFLVALPLCLGIALASNAPLYSGILAGIIGGIIIPLISKSQLSVSGPAAGLTVIVASAIDKLGSFEIFLDALILAGILQLIMGFLGGGVIAYLFPSSVIKGMLAAIGLILVLKQLPHAIGYDVELFEQEEFLVGKGENTFTMLSRAFEHIESGALIISLVSIALLIIWENPRLKKLTWMPGALVAVATGTFLNFMFGKYFPQFKLNGEHLVSIPDTQNLNIINFPEVSHLWDTDILITAFTIAIVASIETLLTVEAVDKIDPYKRQSPTNLELKAQGIANTLSGFIGGLPLTAVIVRSSTNINAGGRTKWAAFFHGWFLLGAVMLIPDFLNIVPLATLSCILIFVGIKLASPKIFKENYKDGLSVFIPFIVTVVAILLTDLLIGIGIGTAVGIFFVIRTNFHSAIGITKTSKEVIIHLNKDVSFLNKSKLVKILSEIPSDKKIVIDGSKAEFIDKDIYEIIRDFKDSSEYRKIGKIELRDISYKIDGDENAVYKLLEGNKEWVKEKVGMDPNFFKNQAKGQSPKFLWIGCSDSRIPANEVTNTNPGEIFVHRNIANLVIKTDFNLMSVLQYAVHVLKVKHVIVCGHYGCGGIQAAMGNNSMGLIDNWLGNIKDVYSKHETELNNISDITERGKRLVELNVIEQVSNLSKTATIQEAWKGNKFPIIHSWVYDIENGVLKDIQEDLILNKETIPEIYKYKV